MKLVIGLALVSLAFGSTFFPTEKDEVDLVSTSQKDQASGRIAVPPPNNLRKIFSDVSTYFIRNVITSLLASAPIRNGGIVNAAPILNPVASPIVNTGTAGALVGGGASQVFFSPVRINIDQASQLYVPPGTDGRIIVLLKNDGVGDFFLLSGGDDKNFFIQFDYAQIQLGPGQTLAVPGRIRVPHYANNVVSTLTIIVQRRTDNAISRRQVYIRTKSEPGEKWAPWCTIRTVTRCDSYLDESICASRYWNMRAEIQDTEAGLLSVSIKPDGRFLGEDFIIGTNESIAVEQSVSCCTTGVDITAVDVRGNTATCRADQYSIYLSSGDVAAITLGVILLILLLVIIILAICRCCRRRKERSIKTAPIPRSKKDQA
ncbi:hypothetical protein DAPPUDRAFT_306032 [Daphnia pulex]|uniref:Uncharacterized protein n=1 Tax=Daphnia pulex TaxID=6669 RepID=E9GU72_DAPPU|nr:hypothetical protein DAPPUDRAFT_306032 [Daphnia pulex]|eukprot:EFX77021.1 hypothetical protein DAPPUDRAFT_306032 [Daphnia pulex]